MRRLAPIFVASLLGLYVGCEETTVTVDWIDPCLGTCLADEVCIEDVGGAACYPMSDCVAPFGVCYYSDGSAGCVDLDYDPYNCGACGAYCDGYCFTGFCEPAGWTCLDVGLDDCYDYCADLQSDPANCGACGNWCLMDEICAGGACYAEGFDCSSLGLVDCGYGCVDPLTDPYNCGACGIECVNGCDGAGECL